MMPYNQLALNSGYWLPQKGRRSAGYMNSVSQQSPLGQYHQNMPYAPFPTQQLFHPVAYPDNYAEFDFPRGGNVNGYNGNYEQYRHGVNDLMGQGVEQNYNQLYKLQFSSTSQLKRKASDAMHDNRGQLNHKKKKHRQQSPPSTRSSSSTPRSATSSCQPEGKIIYNVPGDGCDRITEAIAEYYNEFHQSEGDLRHKIMLSNCLYAIVKNVFPSCRLFIVGSSLSGFGTRTSDMDLCLLVTQQVAIDQRHEAVHILNAIHKALRCCTFVKSSQVIRAKVPILKFTDALKNIECDLNINNGVGIRNTHLLKYYCMLDARVGPLMLFIKFWARFHDINDAHKRTISSYSLALMLIHYLQVCSPPVLPCLQKLHPHKFSSQLDLRNLRLDDPFDNYHTDNTASLGKLFLGFLEHYAYTFRPSQDVISIRDGGVLPRNKVRMNSNDAAQWKWLCIEEPFDGSNTARSVFDLNIFRRVMHVFERSARTLKETGDVKSVLSQPF